MKNLIHLTRPKHWVKNLLVFSPIFFSGQLFNIEKLRISFLVFFVFCVSASLVYVINDLFDRKHDQSHPIKKTRPIAAGQISISKIVVLIIVLFLFSNTIMWFYVPKSFLYVYIYIALNIAYSMYLKDVPIVDITIISIFYVLKILAGGADTSIVVSNWLILCVFFGSIFLTTAKRMAEHKAGVQRRVLKKYNALTLQTFLTISAVLMLGTYAIYTVLGQPKEAFVYSVLFVMMVVFRYIMIGDTTTKSEYPEILLVTDWFILVNILCWICYSYLVLYL